MEDTTEMMLSADKSALLTQPTTHAVSHTLGAAHDRGIWSGDIPKKVNNQSTNHRLRAQVKLGRCNSSPALSEGGGSIQIGDIIEAVNKSLEPL